MSIIVGFVVRYNWQMNEQGEIVVARISPYPLEEHGGVANNILGGIRPLQDEGITVYPVGPRRLFKKSDPRYVYGTAILGLPHDGTRNPLVIASNRGAQRLLDQLKPDIVHIDEPVAAIGQVIPLILNTSRRSDGRPKPAFGATFHARLEEPRLRDKTGNWVAEWIPIIKTYFGLPSRYRGRLLPIVRQTFENRLIAVSSATATFWQKYHVGPYEILPNGFDTTVFSPEGPKIKTWDDGKKTVFMTGRHDIKKGIDTGILAYAQLRKTSNDVKLMIAGEGQETKRLKALVQKLGIPDVTFMGFLPLGELIKAFRTADVFVAPSSGGEGFGRVIAESLACGTPVVASDIDGYREAMGNQPFAQVVSPRFPGGFASAIGTFLDLPGETRERWKKESWQYVAQNFGWPVIARRQADTYRRWLSEYNDSNPNLI